MSAPSADEARLTLRHTLHAGPEEVFRAWVDAQLLARWFTPHESFAVEEVGPHPRDTKGFRIAIRSPAGEKGTLDLSGFEVEPPRRLAFDFRARWPGADEPATSRVSVELRERGGLTDLELVQEGIGAGEDRRELELAWYGCLGRLPLATPGSLARFAERMGGGPRFHSRFGGFWTDLDDADARIRGRAELGLLSADEAQRFRSWVAKGHVVLEGAVEPAAIDRLMADVDAAWRGELPGLWIEHFRDGGRDFAPIDARYRGEPHKVLDLHGHSAAAREVIFSPAILGFLTKLFERPALAFQSLLFARGTEQGMHQDTAYVLVRSPLEFVGCWIALEDVRAGAGELRYYEGSHRIDEFLWPGGTRAKPYDYLDEERFLAWMHDKPRELGLPLVTFRPRKGDALIWHADLVHGGSPVTAPGLTRHSLVTHLCPVDVEPDYFGTSPPERFRHSAAAYTCHRRRASPGSFDGA